jgi:hypothetical protein
MSQVIPAGTVIRRAQIDVLTERTRQHHAFGDSHDDMATRGQIAAAATCYAATGYVDVPEGVLPTEWPWEAACWKPRDRRRNLVKAAALLLAEIERIDRHAAASHI